MYFVKYENPEGEHLKVAKAEAPPQTPPAWPRLAEADRTLSTLTVEAVSLREKRSDSRTERMRPCIFCRLTLCVQAKSPQSVSTRESLPAWRQIRGDAPTVLDALCVSCTTGGARYGRGQEGSARGERPSQLRVPSPRRFPYFQI